MPYLSINQQSYYYQTTQPRQFDAEVLVCLHGSGGDGSVWEELSGLLGGEYTVIRPDLPGHGKSGGSLLESAADYARWLGRLVKELVLPRLFLAGHSLGGAIVQEYAALFPQALKGIVLAGTGASFAVQEDYVQLLRSDFEAAVKASCAGAYAAEVPPEIVRRGTMMLKQNGPEVLQQDLMVCKRFDGLAVLPKITTPALILCGSEDSITPALLSQNLVNSLSESELHQISDAGHMVMNENPERVSELVRGFVVGKQ
ncbi:MAG: alpha/beta hydrolase [Deltaproteobacteria bacterium]|nr:alpha/beta hydrolase [Deltaproteobacteria bacterium]